MKRKIALIAAATTAFSVIILASVVYGYRVSAEDQAAASALAESQPAGDVIESVPLVIPRLSPEQAAALASASLGGIDPFSVQLANYYGVQVYKVIFPDGAIVYISTSGQMLTSVPAPDPTQVTQVTVIVTHSKADREARGGAGGGEDSGEHESEHESGGDD